MKTVLFKGTAIFAMAMAAYALWAYGMTISDPGLMVRSVRVGVVVLLLTMIGIGLFYSRKWAAVFASVFCTYIALRLLYDSSGMQSGMNWLIVSLFVLLLTPLIGTIKYWRSLKPGGRWYL